MTTRRTAPALAVLLASTSLALVAPAIAAEGSVGPGDPFPGFVTAPNDLSDATRITAVGVQSTGRIVIAQQSDTSITLRRLRADGTADPTFGTDGRVAVGSSPVHQLLVLPDDRIVTAAADVRRFSAGGSVDRTFDGDGVAALPLDPGYTNATTTALLRGPEGSVVVVGDTIWGNDDVDVFAARYLPDGSRDPAFRPGHAAYFSATDGTMANRTVGAVPDGDGYHLVGTSSNTFASWPSSWRLDPDPDQDGAPAPLPVLGLHGVVAGTGAGAGFLLGVVEGSAAVIRVMVRGDGLVLDKAWANNGVRTFAGSSGGLHGAVQPDGRLVVSTTQGMVRLEPDGSTDESFVPAPWSSPDRLKDAYDVTTGPDGSVVVVGAEMDAGVWESITPFVDKYVGQLADVSTSIAHSPAVGLSQHATITYRNAGPDGAELAQVVVQTPTGASTTVTPSQGTCDAQGTTRRCVLGAVSPGGVVTVEVDMTWLGPFVSALSASGTSELFDPDTSDRQSTVTVTATDPSSSTPPPVAAPSSTITQTPSTTTLTVVRRPAVKGTAKVGGRLRATTGTWSPTPTSYRFQWLRGGKVIRKATARAYRLTPRDRGTKISVRVTATRAGLPTATATSRPVRVR